MVGISRCVVGSSRCVVGSSRCVISCGRGVVLNSLSVVIGSNHQSGFDVRVVSVSTLHKACHPFVVGNSSGMICLCPAMVAGILRHALCFSGHAVGLIDDTLRLVVLAKLFLLYALCFCGNTSLFGGHTALFLTDAGLLLAGTLLLCRYALLFCGHTSLLGCHTCTLSIYAALLCRYSSVLIIHALRLVSGNGIVECLDAVTLFLDARKVDDQEPPCRVSQRMAYVARLQRAIHTQPRGVLHHVGVSVGGGGIISALPCLAYLVANLLNFIVHIFFVLIVIHRETDNQFCGCIVVTDSIHLLLQSNNA